MGVEVIWPDVSAKHHIVVEVNELLREPRDAVDVGLDGRGAECGEVATILEDILEDTKQISKHVQINVNTILFLKPFCYNEKSLPDARRL